MHINLHNISLNKSNFYLILHQVQVKILKHRHCLSSNYLIFKNKII